MTDMSETQKQMRGESAVTGCVGVRVKGSEGEQKAAEGETEGTTRAPCADWCQMAVNHLMERPLISADTRTHTHARSRVKCGVFSARYKSCGGKKLSSMDQWMTALTRSSTHTQAHTHTNQSAELN